MMVEHELLIMEVQQLEHIFSTVHTNFHTWFTAVGLGASNMVQGNVSQGMTTENKLMYTMKNNVTISTHVSCSIPH
jgi:hypothetical protein